MTAPSATTCSHCGISFRWRALVVVAEDGSPQSFCCRGCQGAYALICASGLSQFYQRDDRQTPTVAQTLPATFSAADLAAHLIPDGELCRIDILIGGISCPSCVWLLERMLAGITGVEHVSLSYSGGIASIRFDPVAVAPLEIFHIITRLGYTPRPYSADQSEQAARHERDDLLLRFGTAVFLTMQLMAYSYALYAGYLQGMGDGMKRFLQYVSLAVTTPVVFYSGWPFLAGAWRSLRTAAPGMDLLIAIGALSAWSYSLWALLTGQETYFESAATIITFVLIGRLLELSVRRRAMSGISALYASAPQQATLLAETGHCCAVPVDRIRPGDLLLVRQGERFPVDCLLLEGEGEVDQSLATGESIPVLLKPGDDVRSGCINLSAPLKVQALRPAGQSYLMRVAALVQMAQAAKPAIQQVADRVAGWFVPAVVLLAMLVGGGRFLLVGVGGAAAVMTALSVLLIACPCAMGLAVPAAVLAACSRSAALGMILRNGAVIERLAQVRVALFDKTGTITVGQPQVLAFETCGAFCPTDVLQAAASLEQLAAHPLARAIVQYAAAEGLLPQGCRQFRALAGRGISGVLPDDRRVLCGNAAFLEEQGCAAKEWPAVADATVVLVAINAAPAGRFLLIDQLRSGAGRLAAELAAADIEVRLISGDRPAAVECIAADIGVTVARGGMTPDQKLAYLQGLQQQGISILMVGDGVNDAPALAAATVSCSLTGSTDIAMENADIIISSDNLARIADACRLSRATMTIIKQNLAWAFLYNLIGIPLAAVGLLTPIYAAAAMTASSLLVSLNSLRLMRFKAHG